MPPVTGRAVVLCDVDGTTAPGDAATDILAFVSRT